MALYRTQSQQDPSESWRVLEASGYIEKWVPAGVRAAASAAHLSAAAESRQVVVLADEGKGPICTAGSIEECPGEWLLQNLGRAPGAGDKDVVVGTILTLIDQLVALGARHFTVFADADAHHSRRLFEPYASGADSTLRFVDVYLASTAAKNMSVPRGKFSNVVVGPEGANVAGFCNRIALEGMPTEEGRLLALEAARALYWTLGKSRFIFLDQPSGGPVPPDFTKLGLGLWWEFGLKTLSLWRSALVGMATEPGRWAT